MFIRLSIPEIDRYQYLWDGSQPGWVLIRLYGSYVDLALKFDFAGPSNQEFMAVRRAVSEFKSLPLDQVIVRLRGKTTYPLGRFESIEARRVAAYCRNEGLNLLQEVIDTPRFLATNEINNTVLLIEDKELAKRVHDTALLYGIPVKQVEF